MHCNKCGYELGSSPFCPHCGAPATQQQQRQQMLEQQQQIQWQQQQQQQQWQQQSLELTPKKSKKPLIIAIIIAVILVAAAALILFFALSNDSEKDDSEENKSKSSFQSSDDDNDKEEDKEDKEAEESSKLDDEKDESSSSQAVEQLTYEDYALTLLNDYGEAIINCDSDLYLSILPDTVAKHTSTAHSDVEEMLQSQRNFFEKAYGSNLSFSYAIDYFTKLDNYEIEELNDDIEDKYGSREAIDEAYAIDYTQAIASADGSTYSTGSAVIVFVNGQWYLYI